MTRTAVLAALLCAAATLAIRAQEAATLWPTRGWTVASPASQGLSGDALDAIDRGAREGVYGNVDAILVVRNGRLVADYRYDRDYREISRGHDGPIGCGEGCDDPARLHQYNYLHPRWHPYFQGTSLHTLQSVTKSIAATIIGLALEDDEIASLDAPLLPFFENRDLTGVDARLRTATLRDLLTMRTGIEWHETDRPLDDTNTTLQLERSDDWIAFTLSQPMDADPGTKWAYNSGGSALMAGVIRDATGRHIDEYAARRLFAPLGIRAFHWKRTPTTHPDTEGGLYLSAPDLAKIGYLYLRDGMWEERRLLPEGWVRDATSRHVTGAAGGWDYGYQWWVTSRGGADGVDGVDGVDIWAARGFGGQFLILIPSRDIVAVVNAWNVFGVRSRGIFEPLVEALLSDVER